LDLLTLLEMISKLLKRASASMTNEPKNHRGLDPRVVEQQTLLVDGQLVELASLGQHLQVVDQIPLLDEQLLESPGLGDHLGYCLHAVEQ